MSIDLYDDKRIVRDWRRDVRAARKYQFIHHFLPHPEENRRATLLAPKSFLLYCAVIVLITGLFRFIPQYFPNILGYATDINITDLLDETNKRREAIGLNALKMNSELSIAAKRKAEHMFKYNYWAHISPDGTEPWDFILNEKYDYIFAGENLAKNFSSSKEVVEAWYNSPSHKDNLLNKNYSEIGFAIVDGELNGNETTLVVQMFGKPRSAPSLAYENDKSPQVQPSHSEAVPVVTETEKASVVEIPQVEQPIATDKPATRPLIDVRDATRTLTMLFGSFIAGLLIMDLWYSKRHSIIKLSGHTLLHLTFLIMALAGIWFVLRPGSIL